MAATNQLVTIWAPGAKGATQYIVFGTAKAALKTVPPGLRDAAHVQECVPKKAQHMAEETPVDERYPAEWNELYGAPTSPKKKSGSKRGSGSKKKSSDLVLSFRSPIMLEEVAKQMDTTEADERPEWAELRSTDTGGYRLKILDPNWAIYRLSSCIYIINDNGGVSAASGKDEKYRIHFLLVSMPRWLKRIADHFGESALDEASKLTIKELVS